MPSPLFVVGKHRSGTTWLANQLCQHPSLIGVQHARHHGIHESAYFSHIVGRYGDLTDRSNYGEFVEVLAASDYFRLAGVDREALYRLWPATYADVFRRVMDGYASGHGARYWVEKTPRHTLEMRTIAGLYPDARFVGIVRDVVDVVASSLGTEGHRRLASRRGWRWRHLARTTASWVRYRRELETFAGRSPRLLLVRYEDMRRDLEAVLREACAFLDLDFHPGMCESAFPPMSSFADPSARTVAPTELEARAVRLLAGALRVVPMRPWMRRRSGPRERGALPAWFFRLTWDEVGRSAPAGDREASERGRTSAA